MNDPQSTDNQSLHERTEVIHGIVDFVQGGFADSVLRDAAVRRRVDPVESPTAAHAVFEHVRRSMRPAKIRFSDSGKQFAKMALSFRTKRSIEFVETDMAGIVHYSNFYHWMEQTEHAFLRSLGLPPLYPQDDGTTIGFPRVFCSCRFLSPARFEDELDVLLTVQRIGVKSLTYDITFSLAGRLVARGAFKSVCCLFRPGKPLESIELPDLYRSKLEEYALQSEA